MQVVQRQPAVAPRYRIYWGDSTTTEETGSLKILMNCPAECDASNRAVTGLDIAILSARFRVVGAAAAGSTASALTLRVNSMLNFGNNFIVAEQDALVLDSRDGGQTAGTLIVEAPITRGLFAYFQGGSASLRNTVADTEA